MTSPCALKHHHAPVLLAVAALLFTACPGKEDGTATDSGSTGTAGASTDPGATGTDSTGTGDPEPTGGSGDTGTTPNAALCDEACAHLLECESDVAPTLEACVAYCKDSALTDRPQCVPLTEDWWTCMKDVACEDSKSAPYGACQLPYANYLIGCATCPADAEATGPDCNAIVECPEVLSVAYVCQGETCTCSIDDEAPYKTCPKDAACGGTPDEILLEAQACCGVPFPTIMGE